MSKNCSHFKPNLFDIPCVISAGHVTESALVTYVKLGQRAIGFISSAWRTSQKLLKSIDLEFSWLPRCLPLQVTAMMAYHLCLPSFKTPVFQWPGHRRLASQLTPMSRFQTAQILPFQAFKQSWRGHIRVT